MSGQGSMTRSLLIGAVAGLLVVSIAVAATLAGTGAFSTQTDSAIPTRLLVVAATQDADGATVAGIAFLMSDTGAATQVDTRARVDIAGTSYDMVRDAYSFGGGAGVARAVDELYSEPAPLEWVVLPAELWIGLVDSAGGVPVEVRQSVNVYVDNDLYSIERGAHRLTGAEVHALAAVAAESERGTEDLGAALSAELASDWTSLVTAVADGQATSSLGSDRLKAFGASF